MAQNPPTGAVCSAGVVEACCCLVSLIQLPVTAIGTLKVALKSRTVDPPGSAIQTDLAADEGTSPSTTREHRAQAQRRAHAHRIAVTSPATGTQRPVKEPLSFANASRRLPPGSMDGFAVDDPSGIAISAPGVALPEKALRCSSTPGTPLALVRPPRAAHVYLCPPAPGGPSCRAPAHVLLRTPTRRRPALRSPAECLARPPAVAQTNKAWVSPSIFHEMSAGQLDCYVEYCNYIFLLGCAPLARLAAVLLSSWRNLFATRRWLTRRAASEHTGRATRWRTDASRLTASSASAARSPRATSSPVRGTPPCCFCFPRSRLVLTSLDDAILQHAGSTRRRS